MYIRRLTFGYKVQVFDYKQKRMLVDIELPLDEKEFITFASHVSDHLLEYIDAKYDPSASKNLYSLGYCLLCDKRILYYKEDVALETWNSPRIVDCNDYGYNAIMQVLSLAKITECPVISIQGLSHFENSVPIHQDCFMDLLDKWDCDKMGHIDLTTKCEDYCHQRYDTCLACGYGACSCLAAERDAMEMEREFEENYEHRHKSPAEITEEIEDVDDED